MDPDNTFIFARDFCVIKVFVVIIFVVNFEIVVLLLLELESIF
jgi:hypothetical protein